MIIHHTGKVLCQSLLYPILYISNHFAIPFEFDTSGFDCILFEFESNDPFFFFPLRARVRGMLSFAVYTAGWSFAAARCVVRKATLCPCCLSSSAWRDMAKSLAVKAPARVWDIRTHTDLDVACLERFWQYVCRKSENYVFGWDFLPIPMDLDSLNTDDVLTIKPFKKFLLR